jgi:hypothetical protein
MQDAPVKLVANWSRDQDDKHVAVDASDRPQPIRNCSKESPQHNAVTSGRERRPSCIASALVAMTKSVPGQTFKQTSQIRASSLDPPTPLALIVAARAPGR